ncbi:MAG: hypothetical protein WCC30_16935 [Candidatus Dormiibacterota bacterium]
MLDLASSLSDIPETRRDGPWAGHEHVKGWAVFGLPFDSGHVLALRVLPQSNVTPYRSLYHRNPQGNWALYVDGPKACACTRYYGSACELTGYTRLRVEWTGLATVHITLNEPAVDWTFTATSDWRLGLMNTINAALPMASWRSRSLLRARELAARALGLGDLRLRTVTPSGHVGTFMPERIYFIEQSSASFDGVDLGRPAHWRENPMIGSLPLPTRGILASGQAVWQTRDQSELDRMQAEIA